jgi:hypothetical protein
MSYAINRSEAGNTYIDKDMRDNEDPIIELINNEIGPIRVMNRLKLSGIEPDDQPGKMRFRQMRQISDYLEISLMPELLRLVRQFNGKELRKELHQWARNLTKKFRLKLLARDSIYTLSYSHALANNHMATAIFNAFKKLKK